MKLNWKSAVWIVLWTVLLTTTVVPYCEAAESGDSVESAGTSNSLFDNIFSWLKTAFTVENQIQNQTRNENISREGEFRNFTEMNNNTPVNNTPNHEMNPQMNQINMTEPFNGTELPINMTEMPKMPENLTIEHQLT